MDLASLLKRYRPLDKEDSNQAEKILQFVQTNPDCLERSNTAGHITGSAWLVDPSGTKVLLTHHRKLGRWLQLGGHVDGESDVLAAALREAREESGLKKIHPLSEEIFDVDVHLIPAHKNDAPHFHYDIRFLFQAEDVDVVISDESNKLAWIEIDKISKVSSEKSLLRMARKWKRATFSK